jgi:hypothetical protein
VVIFGDQHRDRDCHDEREYPKRFRLVDTDDAAVDRGSAVATDE